jgi:hypothetical protein
MIFITRKLYDGVQIDSGWERRAEREWKRRDEIYRRYIEAIAPMLPTTVRRLGTQGIHDAKVESVVQEKGSLCFVLDTSGALGAFRGGRVRLIFSGLRRRIPTRGLRGQWWLYEEAHLSHRARFSLHVMFNRSDMEIEADELLIEKV